MKERYNAAVAVEDLPRGCLGNSSSDFEWLVANVPDIKICYDTNHLLGEEATPSRNVSPPHIANIHVSDYDGVDERHWMPGRGIVEWPKVIDIPCGRATTGLSCTKSRRATIRAEASNTCGRRRTAFYPIRALQKTAGRRKITIQNPNLYETTHLVSYRTDDFSQHGAAQAVPKATNISIPIPATKSSRHHPIVNTGKASVDAAAGKATLNGNCNAMGRTVSEAGFLYGRTAAEMMKSERRVCPVDEEGRFSLTLSDVDNGDHYFRAYMVIDGKTYNGVTGWFEVKVASGFRK